MLTKQRETCFIKHFSPYEAAATVCTTHINVFAFSTKWLSFVSLENGFLAD
jgi:hypothetical protein